MSFVHHYSQETDDIYNYLEVCPHQPIQLYGFELPGEKFAKLYTYINKGQPMYI